MPTQSAHSYQQQEASQNHGEVDCVLDRGILHSPEEALEESGPVFANEPDHNRLKVMADIDLSAHTATETLADPGRSQ